MAEHEVTETTTRKIYVYPCVKCGCDDIEIYNGHGDKTTLKEEIENNIYFK